MLGLLQALGLCQPPLDIAQALVAVEHIVDRVAVQRADFLLHVGDTPVGRYAAAAGVGFDLAAQQGEQTGFAGTIGPQQADFLAGMQGEVGVFKQSQGAALQGKGVDAYHGAGVYQRRKAGEAQ